MYIIIVLTQKTVTIYFRYSLLGSIKAWFRSDETRNEIGELCTDGWLCLISTPIISIITFVLPYINNNILCSEVITVNLYSKINS